MKRGMQREDIMHSFIMGFEVGRKILGLGHKKMFKSGNTLYYQDILTKKESQGDVSQEGNVP